MTSKMQRWMNGMRLEPGRLALWTAALLALGAGRAVAQPANDFFTNALTIAGFSGTVTGSTVGATVELNEPQVIENGFPVPNGASVWFRWVAPGSGTVFFNTVSLPPQLDTVLAAYDGTNILTILQLAANDDYIFIGGPSQVAWVTQAGTEYRVKLSGWAGFAGDYTLNWVMVGVPTNQPPVPGGIQFEFDTYLVSEGAPGYANVSVTYGGGAPGQVSVDYSTADGTAQDGLHYISRSGTLTFQFGESNKSFTIPIFDNPEANSNRTVNLSLSNPVGATLGPLSNAVLSIVDDETVPFIATSGRLEFSSFLYAGTEWESLPGPFAGSPFDSKYSVRGVVVTVNRVGGSTGRVLVDYTTIDDPFFGGAIAFVDYMPTNGTLVFDDGQTSTNFVVGVGSDFFAGTGSPAVPLVLSNPRAAPGENPAVIVPTLGLLTNSVLQIVEVVGVPLTRFTFERLNFRGVEYGQGPFDPVTGDFFDTTNGFSEMEVEILLPGGGPGEVFLDLVPLYGHAAFPGFPLQAGSDNADLICGLSSFTIIQTNVATNTFLFPFPNTDYTDGSAVITNFPDVEPNLAGINAVAGTLNVINPCRVRVIFPQGIERVSVFIPLVNDNVVEFNEDISLRLTQIGGQPPVNPLGRFATATILDDEEPSGVADRMWNPDNVFFTTNRAYNLTPGANNTVNSLAVDRNQKTVIVGDFTAYNATSRRGVARINIDGSLDQTFTPGTGANGPVTDVGIYSTFGTNAASVLNDRIIVVGIFSSYDNQPRKCIARLNPDGTLDGSFNPGAGVTLNGGLGIVRSVALQSDGKAVIAGEFTHYNGIPRQNVARINADGSLDTTFDTGAGPNATVWSVALLETAPPFLTGAGSFGGQAEDINVVDTGGKQGVITVNYNFYFIEDELRIYYEGVLLTNTLYINGSGTFSINYGPGQSTVVTIVMNQGSGLFGTIWDYTASIQTIGEDKKMMIGGDFTSVNGVAINRIARLNANGALDLSFNPGGGVNGTVRAIGGQGDNRILIGGAFDTVDFRSRSSIARFLPDGTLDTDYDPGSGFDGPVFALQIDSSGKALCGGPFKSFNGTRRVGMARLFNHGALDTSFLDTGHNQFAGLIHGLSEEPRSFVNKFALQNDGNIMIGGSFTNIGCRHTIDLCETNILPRDVPFFGSSFPLLFEVHTWNRQEKRTRQNVARLIGGRTPGPGNVQFTYGDYGADEDTGNFTVTMSRVDGRLGTIFGEVATSNRTAQAGNDYASTRSTPTWFENAYVAPYSIGYVEPQYFIISLTNDFLREGDEVFDMGLFNPVGSIFLGDEFIPLGGAISRSRVPTTIVDDDFDHGIIAFSKPVFTASEDATNLTVTLVRTNGSSGLVTVDYFFPRNGTAIGGIDFTNLPDRTVFTAIFGQGVTSLDVQIPIFDDVITEPDKTFFMVLTNATGGAKLPGGQLTSALTASLVIIDNDHASGRLNFIEANFMTNEIAGAAIITVARVDGSVGPLSVDVIATSGTAIAGVDFIGVTNRLSWVNGETANKHVVIPLIVDGLVEPNESVSLQLVNFSASSGVGFQTSATLTIGNDDAFGQLVFSQPIYDANENGTNVTIIVNRVGGVAGTVSCTFQTEDGTAVDGQDYLGNSGTLVFGPGEFSKSFQVTLLDNSVSDGDRVVTLRITNFVLTAGGPVTVSLLRIIDDESVNTPAGSLDTTMDPLAGANSPVYALSLQPDGKILIGGDFRTVNRVTRNRMARLHPNGLLDPTFNAGLGPNRPVRAIAYQPDGRLVIGGFFDRVHGTNRTHIARLLSDGSLDIFFDPGAGADNPVYALALAPDGQVLAGGSFTTFDTIPRAGIVMLNTNGTVDATFNPGEGANGTVYAVAIQPDGKVLLGGDFSVVGRTVRPFIARLNRDGSVDASFILGAGPNGAVRAITLQADGGILLGGSFTTVDGHNRGGLARLNPDGSLDQEFLSSDEGANGAVLDIELQADGNIIAVGDFTVFNGVTRRRITRLYTSGKTDPTINFGEGANSFIAAAVIQPDRRIVIGGGFTSVQGQQRNSVARLYGGSIAGPGSIEFSRSSYLVTENTGQATITVRRAGGTTGEVSVDASTTPGTATAGLDYTNVTASLFFPEGEVEQTFVVPLVNDIVIEPDETVTLSLANLTGGATPGEVPESTLVIQSDDSLVGFSGPSYTVNENDIAGYASITVVRGGTTNGSVSIDFLTRPGTAVAPDDYTNVTDTLTFVPGETVKTFHVPIANDPFVEGDEIVGLFLTNITGASQLGISAATLVIKDDDFSPGRIQFASANFVVNEYETNAVITVVRTNGTTGIVEVDFNTSPGTAQPGTDYQTRSGRLTFPDGTSVNTFSVPIAPDFDAETNETVTLTLMNPRGGAVIGVPATAILTILNNNLINGAFSFTATNYTATENNLSVTLAVARHFGTNGVVSVSYRTVPGTAVNGEDYVAVTNTLTWAHLDSTNKLITDIVLVNDGLVEDTELFGVQLFNPTGNAIVGARGTTTVTILDEDVGPGYLGFGSATYGVSENATNALIAVTRTSGRTGVVSIDVTTVPGGTAVAGLDYAPASTNLVFQDGQRTNIFVVTVTNNLLVEGDKTILLAVSNPTGGASTSNRLTAATLAILEDDQPAGSIDASFGGTGANAPVNVVSVQTNNNKLFVGGEFTKFNDADRSHVVRLNQSGSVDFAFDTLTNLNNSVRALAVQADGRLLVGGLFTNVGNIAISYLTRFSTDGSLDQEFLSGLSGADNFVDAIALQTDNRIVIGGGFTTVNGVSFSRIARLEANGALDPGFDPGTGANGNVHALAVTSEGSILVGGDFTMFDGAFAGGIVRLRPDGSVDPTFNTGLGFDDSVRAIVVQPGDNRVLVAGYFTNYVPATATFISRAGVIRLNVDGSVDMTFNPGTGANEYINALALQPDGKILVGGGFTMFNGVERGRLARLNSNGSVDFTFNIGSGADNYINTIALQTDRKVIIGGGFRHFDGAPRNFIARLAGGDNVGSGQFAFSDAVYNVFENSTNMSITVRRLVGGSNAVSVAFATADGTALAGTHYRATNGVLNFGPGETIRTFLLPVIDDIATNANRTLTLQLSNPMGGASLGVPSVATVNLVNDDSALRFSAPRFSAAEGQGSNVVITVERTGSQVGTVTVDFATGTNGTAAPGLDYQTQAGQLVFTNGQSTASFIVPVIDDTLIEVNETVELQIFNQARTYPAGNVSIDAPSAVLEIVDDDFGIGLISFASGNFTVSERTNAATITVTRAGGSAGAASVFFALSLGLTNAATPGADYINTNGLLVFGDGQTMKTFTVPILDDTLVEGPEQIRLNLFNVTGAALGLSSATLTILADEAVFSFDQPTFSTNESAGSALITVRRSPAGTGPVSVRFETSDNTALNGLDYRSTNGTLVFAPGQLTASFQVPIIDDVIGEGNELLTLTLLNPTGESTLAGGTDVASLVIFDNDISFSFLSTNFNVVETDSGVSVQVIRLGRTNGTDSVQFNTSDLTAIAGQDYAFTNLTLVFAPGEVLKTVFVILLDDTVGEGTEVLNLNLVNPSPGSTVGIPGKATITIFDDEDTISMGASAFSVGENAGTAFIPVTRNGAFPFTTVTVQFQTVAGTATAGLDYTNVSGQLNFGFGESFKFISIPITDDLLVEGDETFTVRLFGASGATLISPSNAVVTIAEDDTSVSFGAANFSISETVSNAVIPVVRSGGTAGTVSVDVFTTNGTATAGVDYVGTNVTLVFPPGVTSQSLVIRLNDDLLIEGNETIGLRLVNPTTNAGLAAPTAATLTILDEDASIIVGAGSAIVSESFPPPSGVIDPGETVTVNFGLRNIGNVDTLSLMATLLNTNGITSLSGPGDYGPVAAGGGVVSKPFTFTASGTNGGRVSAVFRLVDGANNLGTVTFDFTLGLNVNNFVNNSGAAINDRGPASPYPSTNIVSGLAGAITKLTVTIANISHTFPDDIDMLLVGPTGAKAILMSDAGSSSSSANPIANVTLKFDDAAAISIPDSNQIVSATYRPANWFGVGSADSFPGVPGPYTNSSLSIFSNTPPNGVWSLFVVDDETGDVGNIAGGWTLGITTTESIMPQADLSVIAFDGPDPIAAGDTLTYTILVRNNGPSMATGVMLTNDLPSGMNFISVSSTMGSCAAISNKVVCNLGALSSGLPPVTVTVLGAPTVPGTIESLVSVSGGQMDVVPANNSFPIKTSVVPLALAIAISHEPNGCVLRWPAPATGYTLQYANSLRPVSWTTYQVAPTVVNGMNTVVLNMTNNARYFRLRAP